MLHKFIIIVLVTTSSFVSASEVLFFAPELSIRIGENSIRVTKSSLVAKCKILSFRENFNRSLGVDCASFAKTFSKEAITYNDYLLYLAVETDFLTRASRALEDGTSCNSQFTEEKLFQLSRMKSNTERALTEIRQLSNEAAHGRLDKEKMLFALKILNPDKEYNLSNLSENDLGQIASLKNALDLEERWDEGLTEEEAKDLKVVVENLDLNSEAVKENFTDDQVKAVGQIKELSDAQRLELLKGGEGAKAYTVIAVQAAAGMIAAYAVTYVAWRLIKSLGGGGWCRNPRIPPLIQEKDIFDHSTASDSLYPAINRLLKQPE